jgi:uncharacterized protein Yka (UPF0111/DUF47 family)
MFGASSRHDQVFYDAFTEDAKHMSEAARLVERWLASGQPASDLRERVTGIREAAGQVLRRGICELRQTWITPFDAQDIRGLLLSLDGIVGMLKATAERAALFQLPDHEWAGAEEGAARLAGLLARCCEELERAYQALPHRKSETEVLAHCDAIKTLERETDVVYQETLAGLYDGHVRRRQDRGQGDTDHANGDEAVGHLLYVVKWREVYDTLEQATDRCAQAALQLESVVEAHG